jgi:hypothetical protein
MAIGGPRTIKIPAGTSGIRIHGKIEWVKPAKRKAAKKKAKKSKKK